MLVSATRLDDLVREHAEVGFSTDQEVGGHLRLARDESHRARRRGWQVAKLRELMQEVMDKAKGRDAPQVHLNGPNMYLLQGDRARPISTMGPVADDFRYAAVIETMRDLGVDAAELRALIKALHLELGL